MTYDKKVKFIDWSVEKNEKLKMERGITYDEVMDRIIGDGLLTIWDNPNKAKYAHQHMFVVELKSYVFLVPHVEERDKIFLKTVFPSRKYTKIYRQKGEL